MAKSDKRRAGETLRQVALYARVSTEMQANGNSVSIDEQIGDMETLSQRMGWKIEAMFVDS